MVNYFISALLFLLQNLDLSEQELERIPCDIPRKANQNFNRRCYQMRSQLFHCYSAQKQESLNQPSNVENIIDVRQRQQRKRIDSAGSSPDLLPKKRAMKEYAPDFAVKANSLRVYNNRYSFRNDSNDKQDRNSSAPIALKSVPVPVPVGEDEI